MMWSLNTNQNDFLITDKCVILYYILSSNIYIYVNVLCILEDTDSLSQASSMGSSGVEEEDDDEPANLLHQHYATLAVGTNGASVFSLLFLLVKSIHCFKLPLI